MDQVCCHGNEQDRYARKDVQDRSIGYREDMHHNDSDEACVVCDGSLVDVCKVQNILVA